MSIFPADSIHAVADEEDLGKNGGLLQELD